MGEGGVGKSSVANALLGREYFKASNEIDEASATQAMTASMKNEKKQTYNITDSPGIETINALDNASKQNIITHILAQGPVDAFILVINGLTGRFGASSHQSLELLGKQFPDFWTKVIIVLNYMRQDKKSVEKREKIKSDRQREAEFQQILRDRYCPDAKLPCFSLDVCYDQDSELETIKFKTTISEIFKAVSGSNSFDQVITVPRLLQSDKAKIKQKE